MESMKHVVNQRKDFASSELVISFEIRVSHAELTGPDGDRVRQDLESLKKYWTNAKPTRAFDGQGAR